MWILDRGVWNCHLFQHIQPSSSSHLVKRFPWTFSAKLIIDILILQSRLIPYSSRISFPIIAFYFIYWCTKSKNSQKLSMNAHGETYYFQICLVCMLLMHQILGVSEIFMELPIGTTWYGCSVLTSESFGESNPTNILTSPIIVWLVIWSVRNHW